MAETQNPVPETKPVMPVKPTGGVELPQEHVETYHEQQDVLEGNDPKLRGTPGYQEPRVVRRTVEKQRIVRR